MHLWKCVHIKHVFSFWEHGVTKKGLLKLRAKWANPQPLQYCEQSSSVSQMPGICPIVCLSTPLYCLWSLPSVYPSLVYFNNSVNRGKQMANIPSQKPGVSFWHLSDRRGITDANPLASITVLCHQVSSLVKASLTLKSQSDLAWFWTVSVHGLNFISLLQQFVQKKTSVMKKNANTDPSWLIWTP